MKADHRLNRMGADLAVQLRLMSLFNLVAVRVHNRDEFRDDTVSLPLPDPGAKEELPAAAKKIIVGVLTRANQRASRAPPKLVKREGALRGRVRRVLASQAIEAVRHPDRITRACAFGFATQIYVRTATSSCERERGLVQSDLRLWAVGMPSRAPA